MTETEEFPPMITRLLKAWSNRVACRDVYDLREMVDVLGVESPWVARAIELNRSSIGASPPWSWATIGDALGITRQAAQQRWGSGRAARPRA